jgi:hypothetical protein
LNWDIATMRQGFCPVRKFSRCPPPADQRNPVAPTGKSSAGVARVADLILRAKSAEQKDDEANQQYKANATATIAGAAKIKAAAAEQENKDDNQEEWIHGHRLAIRRRHSYGA